MKHIPAALAATTILALLAITITTRRKKHMDPSKAARKQLIEVLGTRFASALSDAEVIALTPDPNYKPRKYFVVHDMTGEAFHDWADKARIKLGPVPNVPPGIWKLPAGVNPSRWIADLKGDAGSEEGAGSLPSATVWSRWSDGVTFTVVQPSY